MPTSIQINYNSQNWALQNGFLDISNPFVLQRPPQAPGLNPTEPLWDVVQLEIVIMSVQPIKSAAAVWWHLVNTALKPWGMFSALYWIYTAKRAPQGKDWPKPVLTRCAKNIASDCREALIIWNTMRINSFKMKSERLYRDYRCIMVWLWRENWNKQSYRVYRRIHIEVYHKSGGNCGSDGRVQSPINHNCICWNFWNVIFIFVKNCHGNETNYGYTRKHAIIIFSQIIQIPHQSFILHQQMLLLQSSAKIHYNFKHCSGRWLALDVRGSGGAPHILLVSVCFSSGCPSFPSTIKNTSSQCPRAMTQHHIEFNPIKVWLKFLIQHMEHNMKSQWP